MPTPPDLVGTPAAPWRVYAWQRGVDPVDVLLEVQRRWPGVSVPSHAEGPPLRQRHVDERIDELRDLVLEALDALVASGPRFRAARDAASTAHASGRALLPSPALGAATHERITA